MLISFYIAHVWKTSEKVSPTALLIKDDEGGLK